MKKMQLEDTLRQCPMMKEALIEFETTKRKRKRKGQRNIEWPTS